MGVYFEPPRRNATKMWALMRMVAETGLTFHTEGSRAFVQAFIFQNRPPNMNRVRARLEWYRDNCVTANTKSFLPR